MSELSLRGLIEVGSEILSGIFEEVPSAFTEAAAEDWAIYDTIS